MEKDENVAVGRRAPISRIVLNIPHSSVAFPSRKDAEAWPQAIWRQVDRWTDWFTDVIFSTGDSRVVSVIFPYSRFYCDVERLVGDPLEATGQGIFYECFEGLERHWNEEERDRAMCLYHRHMDNLAKAIINPSALLIDCHSFPEDLSDVEICIGLNDDWSRPPEDMVELILSHFRSAGYRTEVNLPYSNSITPPKEFPYKSFMIEVNKRVYLDKTSQLSIPESQGLRQTIRDLYRSILNGCTG